MTPKEIFKKAEYYNRKAAEYNRKVLLWWRDNTPIHIESHPNGGFKAKHKPKK